MGIGLLFIWFTWPSKNAKPGSTTPHDYAPHEEESQGAATYQAQPNFEALPMHPPKELVDDFDENEVAAEAKYRDATKLQGRVVEISTRAISGAVLTLGNVDHAILITYDSYGYGTPKQVIIECAFDNDTMNQLSTLKKDQVVTVAGYRARKILSTVILDGCTVTP